MPTEFLSQRLLAPVPEEDVFNGAASLSNSYPDLDLMGPINQVSGMSDSSVMGAAAAAATSAAAAAAAGQSMQTEEPSVSLQNLQYTAKIYTQAQQNAAGVFRNNV